MRCRPSTPPKPTPIPPHGHAIEVPLGDVASPPRGGLCRPGAARRVALDLRSGSSEPQHIEPVDAVEHGVVRDELLRIAGCQPHVLAATGVGFA